MTRHTRQEAKALGLNKCYGSACSKHPELEGFRWVSGACMECAKEHLRSSRLSNPERTKIQKSKDRLKLYAKPVKREQKRLQDSAYRKNNPKKCADIKRCWAVKNPGATSAAAKLRKHAQKQRTPAWLTRDDIWMMSQAYELAVLRTKMLGFAWEVDHIIPLQGGKVSGLHAPTNLQVIPRSVNRAKWNLYEVAL